MNKIRIESRLSMRVSSNQSQSFSSTSSDFGKSFSDFYVDDDDDDDDDESDSYYYFDWDELSVKKEHNAISWVLTNEAYCFDVTRFSEKLVEATIYEAHRALVRTPKLLTMREMTCSMTDEAFNVVYGEQTLSGRQNTWISTSSDDFSRNQVVMWPKISEFNIKLGLEKLEDYVSTWELSRDWMFCVEFLGFECEESSNVFVYEVEWSKPTPEYPIPQATASVYFALEVFKIVPYNYDRSIQVTYTFEASNVIHHPGKIDFQEKWLEDILEAKLKFFKCFTFSVSNVLFGFSVCTIMSLLSELISSNTGNEPREIVLG